MGMYNGDGSLDYYHSSCYPYYSEDARINEIACDHHPLDSLLSREPSPRQSITPAPLYVIPALPYAIPAKAGIYLPLSLRESSATEAIPSTTIGQASQLPKMSFPVFNQLTNNI